MSSGEVALVKDKTPKKPKSKKPSLATALNPPTAEGIRESSIPTNFSDTEDLHPKREPPADDAAEAGDERAGQKRKRYITVVEGGKKRKIVNIQSFHPDLQLGIENIKQAIAQGQFYSLVHATIPTNLYQSRGHRKASSRQPSSLSWQNSRC